MASIVPPSTDTQDDIPLFEGYEPLPAAETELPLSADRRRTLRQATSVAAGVHPLTGGRLHPLASTHRDSSSPRNDPFTCGSCWFRDVQPHYMGKSFPKCTFGRTNDRRGSYETGSAATDVRAWWPACPNYSPSDTLSPDAARSIPEEIA